MKIRSACIKDAKSILNVYSYYVLNTAITFEVEVPSVSEFEKRIENTLKKYPYIVLEEEGQIRGYAYAGVFKARAAYDHCVETTIYLDKDIRGKGYGRLLYEHLEKELRKIGIINLYACIASPVTEDVFLSNNSEYFHEHMGYNKVGTFNKCGYKFNNWYNMIWMEKFIGDHSLK